MNEGLEMQAGFVALLGAPNAGKSTLLNQLLGEKLSIVTHKAQTTRIRILGILTEGNVQIGLLDTPGIFRPKTRLEKEMVQAAWDSLENVDVALLLLDVTARQPDERAEAILKMLGQRGQKVTLVLNKIDKIKRETILPIIEHFKQNENIEHIFMISAQTGDGVEDLKKHLYSLMPQGAWFYPQDQLTDLPEKLLAAETTREQIFLQLHDELPYGISVFPEKWEEGKDGSIKIYQTIMVGKAQHRSMVLGKHGAKIKAIGSAAREEIGKQLERKIHLFLTVKTDEKWQDKNEYYRLFHRL